MSYEEYPFLTAQAALVEASTWMRDLTLPADHPEREEPRSELCLEQIVFQLDRAVSVLFENGAERKEVGVEVVDGHSVPQIEVVVHDQAAVAAGDAIDALAAPYRAWSRGGPAVTINLASMATFVALLPSCFSARLDGERKAYDDMMDNAPF